MALASEIVTAALVEPSPSFAVNDIANVALRDAKPFRNSGLRHGGRERSHLTHFGVGKFGKSVLRTPNRRPVVNLIGVISGPRIPSKVTGIAAKLSATPMRNFGLPKRRSAVHLFANNPVSKSFAFAGNVRDIQLPVTLAVRGVRPKNTFVGFRSNRGIQEPSRLSVSRSPAKRIAVVAPAVIMALAPSACAVGALAAANRTDAGGLCGDC